MGAAVVAEAAPEGKHVLLAGSSERLDCGKALEESGVAVDDGGDPGLLEHYFRDPDGVRVGGLPPGKVALVAVIPVEEFSAHPGNGCGGVPSAAGHGERLPEISKFLD